MPTNEEKTIPMISEEQRKQPSKEQRDFEVNMHTENLSVKGLLGDNVQYLSQKEKRCKK